MSTETFTRADVEHSNTPEFLARVRAARVHAHGVTCPVRHEHDASRCMGAPTAAGVARALLLLDARGSDVRGARLALHDVVCGSDGCAGDLAVDHATRTQSKTAAAVRRFHARETPAPALP